MPPKSKQKVNKKHRFECHYCGTTFPRKDTMKTHIMINCRKSSIKKEWPVCIVCGLTLSCNNHLLRHQRAYHSISRLKTVSECHNCGKRYASRGSLLRHLRSRCPGRRTKVRNDEFVGETSEELQEVNMMEDLSQEPMRLDGMMEETNMQEVLIPEAIPEAESSELLVILCSLDGEFLKILSEEELQDTIQEAATLSQEPTGELLGTGKQVPEEEPQEANMIQEALDVDQGSLVQNKLEFVAKHSVSDSLERSSTGELLGSEKQVPEEELKEVSMIQEELDLSQEPMRLDDLMEETNMQEVAESFPFEVPSKRLVILCSLAREYLKRRSEEELQDSIQEETTLSQEPIGELLGTENQVSEVELEEEPQTMMQEVVHVETNVEVTDPYPITVEILVPDKSECPLIGELPGIENQASKEEFKENQDVNLIQNKLKTYHTEDEEAMKRYALKHHKKDIDIIMGYRQTIEATRDTSISTSARQRLRYDYNIRYIKVPQRMKCTYQGCSAVLANISVLKRHINLKH